MVKQIKKIIPRHTSETVLWKIFN